VKGKYAPSADFATWSDDERDLLTRLRNGETVVLSMRRGGHPNLVSWARDTGLLVPVRVPGPGQCRAGQQAKRSTARVNTSRDCPAGEQSHPRTVTEAPNPGR
jgi:hypothetical protein